MLRLKVSIPARASLYSSECYPRTPTTPCPAGLSRTRSCPATPRQLFAIQIHHKAAISRKWRWRSDQFGRMFDPFIMQHFTPLSWTNAAGASMTACKRDVQTREGDRANKHAWGCCCWHLLVKRLLEFCLQLIEFNATLPAICAAGLEKRTTTTFHEPNLALKHWNVWKLTCSKLFAKDVILSYLVISRHILSCCCFFSSSAPQPCWAQWRQRRTDCPFLEGNPTGED